MAVLRKSYMCLQDETFIQPIERETNYRVTPFIVTVRENVITDIDMENLLERGLHAIRFKISHITKSDKVVLLDHLKKAIAYFSQKHEHMSRPVAISIDLPNACILTGYLRDDIIESEVLLEKDSIVELTCDMQYWNKCNNKILFMDDSYTFPFLKPGTEISINFGKIVMICIERIDAKWIRCKIELGGLLGSAQFVSIRGVKHKRPPLGPLDKRLLEFVKENELDVVTIHSIRNPITAYKVRNFFRGGPLHPFIMCSICEQEGLDNVEAIIEVADGIILAREFLAQAVLNPFKLTAIQMFISAKCRQHNKPFYVSGGMDNTLQHGIITCQEINDIGNAVMQGAGLLLRSYSSPANIMIALQYINQLCRSVETTTFQDDFWTLCFRPEPPLNAANAIAVACALNAKQTEAQVVIVLTVTGESAVLLSRLAVNFMVLAVTTSETVARRLQLYRAVIPIVYKKSGIKDWLLDMEERIKYAVDYGLKRAFLCYDQNYLVLRKTSASSAFCDHISNWKVVIQEATKYRPICRENSISYNHFQHEEYAPHSFIR